MGDSATMKRHFEWWRLFASVACLTAAVALLRFVFLLTVESYGGGVFPAACLVVGVVLIVAGVGVLFRRAGEFLLYLLGFILKLFVP